MYCMTTTISKGTIISLSRKVCLKKLCVIFQLEMHCKRPMDIKRKGIHKILVIFRLFTNLLQIAQKKVKNAIK